jgi:NAD(P)-dependent dehydrogenase (short-subunit alcohol dehydrogenase family)
MPASRRKDRKTAMSKVLDGKIAVVTGASTGIGLAIAKRFAAEGATVVVTGRRQTELDAAVQEIGEKATGVRADVSKLADLDALYDLVKLTFGRIDVLAANAGGGTMAPLGDISEEQFDQTFATNVKGVLFTVQKAMPLLAPGASVILTGSTTSITGTPAFSVYSASKAAVRNFVRSWVLDIKGKDFRINVLSPGPTKTPGLVGLVPTEHQQGLLDSLAAQVPLGRVGDPDEIAQVAVFLASSASSFVNGVELFADGGQAQV